MLVISFPLTLKICHPKGGSLSVRCGESEVGRETACPGLVFVLVPNMHLSLH